MVSPCGAGSGVIKPGFGRTVVMGAAAIEEAIALVADPAFGILAAPIIAGQSYDLLNICTAGDPGDPVITSGDLVDALNFADILANGTAWRRIAQWFVHIMWPSWCNCSNGTIPPVPTFVAPTLPSVNPGLPAGGVTGPCWDATQSFTSTSTSTTNQDCSSVLPPTPTQAINITNIPPITTGHLLPGGFSKLTVDSSIDAFTVGGSVVPALVWFDNTGAELRIDPLATWTQINKAPTSGTFTPPGTATTVVLCIQQNAVAGREVLFRARWTCTGSTPNAPVVPCCPPDPTVDARLNYLIQLAHANIGLLGQSLKGHIDGTRHSGLSGSGTVTLADSVLAVRVEIKTGLSGLLFNPGSPNYYFSAGFITPVAAGSPLRGSRLIYAAQTYPVPSYTDQIGFTLLNGVTVDIIELLPAP